MNETIYKYNHMNHLFYYTVGYSEKYLDCLKLSIESLRKYNKTSDIIVLVDESLAEKAKEYAYDAKIIRCPNSNTPEEASMRKLNIFDYDIQKYDTVLFIDSDIIIHMDINSLVPLIHSSDKLYVFSEAGENYEEFKDTRINLHTAYYWSLRNYTQDNLNFLLKTDTKVFNAGLFAFKSSEKMKEHFNNVNTMIKNHTDSFFYEQSFMNVYFNLNQMTDRSLFTNYIMFPESDRDYAGNIIHFCGNIADGFSKYTRMKKYVDSFMKGKIITYNTRLDMIKAHIPRSSIIAEIGVFKGTFARQINDILSPTKFFLIDLFSGEMCSGNEDGNNVVYTNMDTEYRQIVEYARDKPYITVIKDDSSRFLSILPDNMLDMIYIDGDHSYEGCKKDLLEAYKKVRNGGYICGHDYEMNMSKAQTVYEFGVKKAVDEFCLKFNQVIIAKGNDGCVSYAIQLKK